MTLSTQSQIETPSLDKKEILCYYVNRSSKVQIVRISNVPNWYFERVVFPGQRLIFEAYAKAQLEVYTSTVASAVLADSIACERLEVRSQA
ncbi:DUF1830 domain-containing protein [Baaleninema sp.]|uniref:DUF1830 domain-containing protein n=1 Tax=Baaleninema sp. TaxID=3101197 RepID=UPI003D02F531